MHKEAGKGDKRRPGDANAFAEGYDRIFKKNRSESPETKAMDVVVKIQQLEQERLSGKNTTK